MLFQDASTTYRLLIFLFVVASGLVAADRPAQARKPICGDGVCSGGETAATCPADCAPGESACGDGSCDGSEDCASCEADCGACNALCGCNYDGVCNAGETCDTCPDDCASAGKGNKRKCCGANTQDPAFCGALTGTPLPDTDGDGVPDCVDGCPTDPFKVEPGERGCGLEDPVRETTTAGVGTTLSVTGATLVIDPDAIPDGMNVSLKVTPFDQSDFPQASFPGEVPLTEVYTVEFSGAAWARQAMDLWVELPAGSPAGLYGRIKTVRPVDFGGHGTDTWRLEIGDVDSTGNALRVPLTSTASSISFVVVARASAMVAAPSSTEVAALSDGPSTLPLKTFDITDWHLDEWVVLCNPVLARCTRDNADLLAQRLEQSVELLAWSPELAPGFKNAVLRAANRSDFERMAAAGFVIGSTIDFSFVADDYPFLYAYLVADGELGENVIGVYADAAISVVESVLDEPSNPGVGDTVIHELFHAAQRALTMNLRASWVLEGTAVAVEVAVAMPEPAERLEYRFGSPRDWGTRLNSAWGSDPYRTSELFLAYDEGRVTYLRNLLADIGALSTRLIGGEASYQCVDDTSTYGLENPYLDLIAARHNGLYPEQYVTVQVCDGLTSCAGEDNIVIQGMSAQKYRIRYDSDTSCASGTVPFVTSTSRELSFVLNSGNPDNHSMLIGDPAIWVAPEEVSTVETDDLEVWVVNHDVAPFADGQFSFVSTQDEQYSCVVHPNKYCAGDSNWCGSLEKGTCCMNAQHCIVQVDGLDAGLGRCSIDIDGYGPVAWECPYPDPLLLLEEEYGLWHPRGCLSVSGYDGSSSSSTCELVDDDFKYWEACFFHNGVLQSF